MDDECIHGLTAGTCGTCTGKDNDPRGSGPERNRTDSEGLAKQEWCDKVADLFGVPKVKMANGSTEPTEYWDSILRQIGVQATGTKGTKAAAIAASEGIDWPPTADSTGSTVTVSGWIAVHKAAKKWRERQDST
jgi:hypothetical protein